MTTMSQTFDLKPARQDFFLKQLAVGSNAVCPLGTRLALILALLVPTLTARGQSQGGPADTSQPVSAWAGVDLSGIKLRNIGPALMSGRIADVAIDPRDENRWYVAAASGGVWKTINAGVTWTPIFDDQSSYSIGCVTVDPGNSNRIWVGTGENVGGRHIGFGDGVYRSDDGGATWRNMGLAASEHISKIIVHPGNSKVIWVAVQGPLWRSGGQRGLYKSTDEGESWRRVLGDELWTGVTDIAIDPRTPSRLYAATWQRHRTVAAYYGGGRGSGLFRSEDGGETWTPLKSGLPEEPLGKIGLAISPQQPDVLYAAIELRRRTGAVYRTSDRGNQWTHMSDAVSGGTGPHYYQELYASPHVFDRIYLADVRIQISNDGGRTFQRLPEKHKHSDNHAMAFRSSDPDYLLVGSDGGLYESFDHAAHWRFIDNLPLTQFYKIAVDDREPFYHVYGGTQDNSTEGGPIRTDNAHGIRNADWRVVLDWDGHQPATEPGNPDILYAERQEGFLSRVDLKTGEVVDIQPQPEPGESFERFNWDAPILVSPHQPKRLYFASQRVWRSDDRGDRWTAISGDLTRHQSRLLLPIMGTTQSWDGPWDISAMSNYNTITSLAESPVRAGLIYAGTDDGLIQVTENGGESWRAMEVGSLPGVPATAFVNDIRADLFHADTVYVALDNHKYGDFQPYLCKSTDRGQTWHSITGNLPPRHLVWRIVQDHVCPELMFLATEFGLFVTFDGGQAWNELTGGVPTISFRDLTIHRRENDLVAASFGRGIFVLDDLKALRALVHADGPAGAHLFPTRDAWWYFPRPVLGFEGGRGDQGASHFLAPNPEFGATLTYYLPESLHSSAEKRQAAESDSRQAGRQVRFPGWDQVTAEKDEAAPEIWLVIRDSAGQVVRRIPGATTQGFHRVSWDLRYPTPDAVELQDPPAPLWGGPPRGLMAAPGTFTAELYQVVQGEVTRLSQPQEFQVKPLRSGTLPAASPQDVAAFWREYEQAVRRHSAVLIALSRVLTKIERMQKLLQQTPETPGETDQRLKSLRAEARKLDHQLNGNRAKQEVGEKYDPVIADRLFAVSRGVDRSTYGPTPTHRRSLEIANEELGQVRQRLASLQQQLTSLGRELWEAGGPWLESEPLPDR